MNILSLSNRNFKIKGTARAGLLLRKMVPSCDAKLFLLSQPIYNYKVHYQLLKRNAKDEEILKGENRTHSSNTSFKATCNSGNIFT